MTDAVDAAIETKLSAAREKVTAQRKFTKAIMLDICPVCAGTLETKLPNIFKAFWMMITQHPLPQVCTTCNRKFVLYHSLLFGPYGREMK